MHHCIRKLHKQIKLSPLFFLFETRVYLLVKSPIHYLKNTTEIMYAKSEVSLCLTDNIFCRIEEEFTEENGKAQKIETWLMYHIYRYVKNPKKEPGSFQKFIGKVKFKKLTEKDSKYTGLLTDWKPPKKNSNGEYIEERDEVDDIQIVVYC